MGRLDERIEARTTGSERGTDGEPVESAGPGAGANRSAPRKQRPLWQFVLPFLLVVFVARRLAVAVALPDDVVPVPLTVAYAVQAAFGLTTATAIWLGRHWAIPCVAVLGAIVVATAVVAGFTLPNMPVSATLGEMCAAVLVVGAFLLILRQEFGPEGTAYQHPPRPRSGG